MVPNDRVTIGTKVDEDFAEQVELLADAEGKNKSEWIREQLESAADESSDEIDNGDLLRVLLERQKKGEDVEIERGDDGSLRVPDPGGVFEKLTDGAVKDPFLSDE